MNWIGRAESVRVLSPLTLFEYLGMCESNSEYVVAKLFVHTHEVVRSGGYSMTFSCIYIYHTLSCCLDGS